MLSSGTAYKRKIDETEQFSSDLRQDKENKTPEMGCMCPLSEKVSPNKKNLFEVKFESPAKRIGKSYTFDLGQVLSTRGINKSLSKKTENTAQKRKHESDDKEQSSLKSAFKPSGSYTRERHQALRLKNALFTMNHRLSPQADTVLSLSDKNGIFDMHSVQLLARLEQQRASMATPFFRIRREESRFSPQEAACLESIAKENAIMKLLVENKKWNRTVGLAYFNSINRMKDAMEPLFMKQNITPQVKQKR